ncbi:MAG: GGDEF domain-containing protein [Clostridia bacterium]|nr:GGDEF domain-containing protein [Clostridia bacterium]
MYRRFLFAVLAYYVTDILWGVLESQKLSGLLFADTTVYFVAMAAGVLLWTQFTVVYLGEETDFGKFLIYSGQILGAAITLLSLLNVLTPILFTVDENGVYSALPFRYVILSAQVLLLLMISGYSFSKLRVHEQNGKYRALGLFGLIMALFLFIQLFLPYLPLYATAYLLGTTLLHTFVLNEEKEEYKKGVEEAQEVRELRDTIVSLLDNMPAMTFTKDAETGVYLACNQALADYAHKERPADVVGLTDAQLFDPETAKHFMEEDRIALSMDQPYIFYEEANDALGNLCQLQTTKQKYHDADGRLCVLGMSQDVSETVRIHRENAASKEAYEKARSTGIMYNHMAQSMARGYLVMYRVNLDTEEYVKYRNDEEGSALEEEERGWHFFEGCRLRAEQTVHPDDRAEVIRALKRKNLVAALEQNKTFALTFRNMAGGEPRDVTLRVSRMEDDERYIILGITDVDEAMKHRRESLRAKEEHIAYARLSALTGNYLCIYVVDPKTGSYHEFSSTQDYASFAQAKAGKEFFNTVREAARLFIHPEDLNCFLSAFTEQNVMSEIERRGIFTVSYRLIMDSQPLYVQLKAAMVEEEEGTRMIVGVNDIDAQVRQEEEYVTNMAKARLNANIDALTGIKNRNAFLEAEERLNKQLDENRKLEFAVILLDVNDLKIVNDTQGHNAGDQLLRTACKIICDTFKHSPVFRIGGDEFAVISQGSDYANIEELVGQMNARNEQAMQNNGVVIACGMAKREGGEKVAPVFERADQKMYENKGELKAKRKIG